MWREVQHRQAQVLKTFSEYSLAALMGIGCLVDSI